ncbi:hypothetical protein Lepto7376_4436 [[Leptolyngbya] sp. PCC 7376]|uniref:hypothetical protein n=1 Tax=[Leptolyngbya] sp. PCC 7376 TaxID=111781 RepID=UPI00029EDF4C|nr:hypothetical protein [[Leptolyngbya] sp. PCC 7376]AFY40539.1 hypothetical protein Lepto7376_4436 [[Leptolyngbya] sp. PCC 7376]
MRHLAQVQINPLTGHQQLLILAHEQEDGSWELGDRLEISFELGSFAVGMLVIVKLSEENKIISIHNATDWLLDVVKQHFAKGVITPDFLLKEQAKIETWRQEITSQSQDLTRRQLEIETRREQLEELEKKLANQDC